MDKNSKQGKLRRGSERDDHISEGESLPFSANI